MRRRVPWWVLAILFVVVPVVEIYLLIQVGQVIGAGWTVLLIIAGGIIGSYLVKHEGSRAWRALQESLAARRVPARELADGALILVGGALLLTPGFVTDAVGLFCILPFTRPLARGALVGAISRRLTVFGAGAAGMPGMPGTPGDPRTRRSPGPDDESVVRGEVVDD